MRPCFLALLLITLTAPGLAAGATFHVATTGSDGSGDGSPGSPWATIEHAVDSVPDGSLVLVEAGLYLGRIRLDAAFASGITVRSQAPYQAQLRHSGTVVTCYYGQGITLEGFDIAHDGPGASALVIQIQDLRGAPGGADRVERIVLQDNVIHDSFNNDLLKINNGAHQITVRGNLFYNQAGSDEHIDVNSVEDVVIEDNVFLNDFAGSGRTDTGTSSFVVIKDSNGNSDGVLGSSNITVRRNVFLHWEGSSGQGYVRVGEDGTANHEADGVLIENNLLLGDNTSQIRSPFQVMGATQVTFRANTVTGNLPAKEFGARIFTYGANPDNDGIHLHNNIWSDPGGSMGDTFNRGDNTINLSFDNNQFWNAGNAFPTSSESIFEVTDDLNRIVGDPGFPSLTGLVLPRWNPVTYTFAGGYLTVREVFEALVANYGVPSATSAGLDAADPAWMPSEDILGNPRPSGAGSDLGAVEVQGTTAARREPGTPGPRALAVSPNPMRTSLAVEVTLEETGPVTLRILDLRGRLVAQLAEGVRGPGNRRLTWNGRLHDGRSAPAGIYLVQLVTRTQRTTARVVRIP